MKIWDCIIVGSGSAGATAGLYTSRGCVENLLLAGLQRGGLLTTTHIVENFPGCFPPKSGPELMEIMLNQAAHYGTIIKDQEVIEIIVITDGYNCNNNNYNLFRIKTYDETYYSKTVIWATGSSPRKLNIPGENTLENKGVSYCAVCDGFFYKDKVVAVVGGGNTAMEESLFLSNIVKEVNIIHRRDEFRGEKILYNEILNNKKINIHTYEVVDTINGLNEVQSITLKNVNTNETKVLSVEGVFIAIGHDPNTQLIKSIINLDGHGYVNATNTHTNIKGFFVAGDVQDSIYRQAVTAAASGCISAMETIKYLKNLGLNVNNIDYY
jgi:thioredoxin reductase (NADPH)